MTTDVDMPPTSAMAKFVKATTVEERLTAARHALEFVEVPWAPRPVPRAFLDLPRAEDDDEDVAWEIAARTMATGDPFSAEATKAAKLGEYVGQQVTVHDLRVRALSAADLEDDPDRKIGAYLVLDVSVGDPPRRDVAFTSSPRVVTPLLTAWATNQLPISGTIMEVAKARGKRSAPLGFVRDPIPGTGEEPF